MVIFSHLLNALHHYAESFQWKGHTTLKRLIVCNKRKTGTTVRWRYKGTPYPSANGGWSNDFSSSPWSTWRVLTTYEHRPNKSRDARLISRRSSINRGRPKNKKKNVKSEDCWIIKCPCPLVSEIIFCHCVAKVFFVKQNQGFVRLNWLFCILFSYLVPNCIISNCAPIQVRACQEIYVENSVSGNVASRIWMMKIIFS